MSEYKKAVRTKKLSKLSRDSSGRYKVALPFKFSQKNLGDSKVNAQVRLLSLEKRFVKFPDIRIEYNKAILDFIKQGHMKL